MTINEAARRWKLSPGRVRKLAKEGRIPGTVVDKEGPITFYRIPDDATRPERLLTMTPAKIKAPKDAPTPKDGEKA